MLPNLGMGELMLVLVIALLLFGGKRLTEVARSLGQSVHSFKKGLSEEPKDPPSDDGPQP